MLLVKVYNNKSFTHFIPIEKFKLYLSIIMLEGVCLFRSIFIITVILLFIGAALVPTVIADVTETSKSKRVTVYYGEVYFYFEKYFRGYHRHINRSCHASSIYLDADLEDLVLDVVMNYTVEMNYSCIFTRPLLFPPILAFGLMVQNYTSYKWETFKMRSYGYDKVEGNISVEVDIEMDNIESGDVSTLQPYFVAIGISTIRDPLLSGPGNRSLGWALLLRILYNTPVFGEYLLYNWLLPILEPYNRFPQQVDGNSVGPYIWLYFH